MTELDLRKMGASDLMKRFNDSVDKQELSKMSILDVYKLNDPMSLRLIVAKIKEDPDILTRKSDTGKTEIEELNDFNETHNTYGKYAFFEFVKELHSAMGDDKLKLNIFAKSIARYFETDNIEFQVETGLYELISEMDAESIKKLKPDLVKHTRLVKDIMERDCEKIANVKSTFKDSPEVANMVNLYNAYRLGDFFPSDSADEVAFVSKYSIQVRYAVYSYLRQIGENPSGLSDLKKQEIGQVLLDQRHHFYEGGSTIQKLIEVVEFIKDSITKILYPEIELTKRDNKTKAVVKTRELIKDIINKGVTKADSPSSKDKEEVAEKEAAPPSTKRATTHTARIATERNEVKNNERY